MLHAALKAVVKQKRGDGFVELTEVPEPEVGEGEVLVRVRSAGICGSDISILHGRFQGYSVPVIMGHEFAGTIEDTGPAPNGLSVGEKVACETHAYVCNECGYCRSGAYNLCPRRRGFGYGADGAFTKYVRVRTAIVHPLPDDLSMDEGAMLEPLSVALNALTQNSSIEAGDSVLIIGPGPIGLMCLQIAEFLGAKVTVAGTETSTNRLKLARKLGAETVSDAMLVKEPPGGRGGFDVSVIATGEPSTFETALRATRPNGRVVQIGESTKRASFPFSLIEKKNLTINGSFSHTWPVWERAISLAMNKHVNLLPLASHRVSIQDWRKGFDLSESRAGLKVLIRP